MSVINAPPGTLGTVNVCAKGSCPDGPGSGSSLPGGSSCCVAWNLVPPVTVLEIVLVSWTLSLTNSGTLIARIVCSLSSAIPVA
mgnify:CR=1 FL=1